MTTKKLAVNQITKGVATSLRPKMTAALNQVLSDYGMKGTIGNITFTPFDMRFKVNIVIVDPASPTTTEIKVRQMWQYGTKTYRIEQVDGDVIIASRPSRGRFAYLNGGRQNYRIDRVKLLAAGVLVKDA